MNIYRHRSFEEFLTHCEVMSSTEERRKATLDQLVPSRKKPFIISGYSYPARKMVDFKVGWDHSFGDIPNFREWTVCPETGLNNRLRACLLLIDIELSLYGGDKIYITEQTTPLYSLLKEKYRKVVGSEYCGENRVGGEVDKNGIRHEDLTKLSFADESFKSVMTFECLEHIPDYKITLKEMWRVLEPGGTLFMTFPFLAHSEKTLTRARIENGKIKHLEEPEYHGDPMVSDGCLCFYHFGWDILNEIRSCDFSDVYLISFSSDDFGNVGPEQLYFVAKK